MRSLTTYREAVLEGAASLRKCGIASPEYDAKQLLLFAAHMSETQYLLESGSAASAQVLQDYAAFVQRRMNREPLQHILGAAYFYGRPFKVSRDVLVPRFDTEVLVECALEKISDGDAVLDMCTGSGCIIITLALERRLAAAVGCDVSQAALDIAAENISTLTGKDSAVTLKRGDLFKALGEDYRHLFDCIVSNPPYIESGNISGLDDEVRLYDPLGALDGGADGLSFYRAISGAAPDYLKDGGYLFFEIGAKQGDAVSELMQKAGFLDICVVKDLAGLDRVVYGHI